MSSSYLASVVVGRRLRENRRDSERILLSLCAGSATVRERSSHHLVLRIKEVVRGRVRELAQNSLCNGLSFVRLCTDLQKELCECFRILVSAPALVSRPTGTAKVASIVSPSREKNRRSFTVLWSRCGPTETKGASRGWKRECAGVK